VLRQKNADPGASFPVNAGWALDAAEVIVNEAPPANTAFGRQGPFKSSHSDQHLAGNFDLNIGTNIGTIRG
jgi:hypothetical protein